MLQWEVANKSVSASWHYANTKLDLLTSLKQFTFVLELIVSNMGSGCS